MAIVAGLIVFGTTLGMKDAKRNAQPKAAQASDIVVLSYNDRLEDWSSAQVIEYRPTGERFLVLSRGNFVHAVKMDQRPVAP